MVLECVARVLPLAVHIAPVGDNQHQFPSTQPYHSSFSLPFLRLRLRRFDSCPLLSSSLLSSFFYFPVLYLGIAFAAVTTNSRNCRGTGRALLTIVPPASFLLARLRCSSLFAPLTIRWWRQRLVSLTAEDTLSTAFRMS